MREDNWIGFLIPAAILVFSVINQVVKRTRRAVDDARAPAAVPAPPPGPGPVPRPAAPLGAEPVTQTVYRRFTPPPPQPVMPLVAPAPALRNAMPLMQSVFGDPDHARRAIILAEILGPPVALRTTSPTRTAF